MDLQTVLQVVADFQAHQWWPLALLLVLWVRKLLSDDSSFRPSVPPRLLHLVTASLTMVTVFVTAEVNHTAIATAALGALVAGIGAGLADGLLTAFFADPSKVPGWAKTVVMLVDELGGETPPVASRRGFVRVGSMLSVLVLGVALILGLGVSQTACNGPLAPLAQTIEQTILHDLEDGQALSAIEAAVVAIDPALRTDAAAVDQLIQAAIDMLEATGVIPVAAKDLAAKRKAEAAKKAWELRPGSEHLSPPCQSMIDHFRERAAIARAWQASTAPAGAL